MDDIVNCVLFKLWENALCFDDPTVIDSDRIVRKIHADGKELYSDLDTFPCAFVRLYELCFKIQ